MKKTIAGKYRPIYIEWIDANGHSGWQQASNVECKVIPVHAIGFVTKETKDCIQIAQNWHPNENGSISMESYTNIPKVCIRRKKWLDI